MPFAGLAALSFRGEQAVHGGQAGDHVPDRHDMVDRPRISLRPGHLRKSRGGVDRVVERDRTVPVAGDAEHDQIVAFRLQSGVVEPAARRQVRQHDTRIRSWLGHQRMRQFPAFRIADIQHDRPFALVQPGPVEAPVIARDRPTPVIEAAADRVDADHVGAHLRQGQAGIGRGDEGRDFDEPKSLHDFRHGFGPGMLRRWH